MIDPGNPFLPGHDMATVVAALQDSVRSGVEHEDFHRFVFDPAVRVYALPREATSVTRVTGLSGGRFLEFVAGRDYDAGLSRIVWRNTGDSPGTAPRRPDTRTRIEVTYRFRGTPSGLTDVGPGSVTGTLLRAVAREVAVLYQQINEAYRRAFLDTANGAALDGVVALLGVTRNPEQAASGAVRFSRRLASARVVVPERTLVEDSAGRRYRTTQAAVLDRDALNADALVTAEQPGPDGNNGPGALTILPTPVGGIDGVSNPEPITGGLAAESDDALRDRARHALERAGNATAGALEFAVRDIDGVEDVAVIDHTVDITVPLGEVRVRYSAGGDEQRQAQIRSAVETVVEATRAAGIRATAETVRAVTIAGRVVVAGAPGGDVAAGMEQLDSDLARTINATGIGGPLSLRKLSALVFQAPGLADVLLMSLTFTRDQAPPTLPDHGDVPDLLPVDHAEHVVAGEIDVVALDGLTAIAPAGPPQPGDPVPVTLTPLHAGQPFDPPLASVRLQVRFEVRAAQLSLPSEPPVVVANVIKTAVLGNTEETDVLLTPDDLRGYDPGKHAAQATVTVTLVGYGVPPTTAVLVLG